jgi:hypothetical protein
MILEASTEAVSKTEKSLMVNSDYQLMVHDYPYYIQKSSHATIIYQS